MQQTRESAIVTGGAKRIGREIALHLAGIGYDVAVHFRDSKKDALETVRMIEKLGRKSCAIAGDLEEADAPEKIIKQAKRELGTLSCLVHNASRFERDTIKNFTKEGWQAHMEVHAYAPLALARAFAAQCSKQADNCIIHMADGGQGWSMSPNFLTYALSKQALLDVTVMLAKALAPDVRVNAIGPGVTLKGAQEKADTFAKLKAMSPLKRLGSIEEITQTISYLLNTPSVTGQIILLNAGMHLRD